MIKFENQERRMENINISLGENKIKNLEEARDICMNAGIDVEEIVKTTQTIAFDNAIWAYTLGAAIALKNKAESAAKAASFIGEGLQAFCIPGSVAYQRNVGLGHGNLAAMLLEEENECFQDMNHMQQQKEL